VTSGSRRHDVSTPRHSFRRRSPLRNCVDSRLRGIHDMALRAAGPPWPPIPTLAIKRSVFKAPRLPLTVSSPDKRKTGPHHHAHDCCGNLLRRRRPPTPVPPSVPARFRSPISVQTAEGGSPVDGGRYSSCHPNRWRTRPLDSLRQHPRSYSPREPQNLVAISAS